MMNSRAMQFLCLCAGFFSFSLGAQPRISFDPQSMQRMEISDQVDIYLDESGEESIEVLGSTDFQGWKRSESVFPSFGVFSGTAWIRVRLQNETEAAQKFFLHLEAPIQTAQLFRQSGGGPIVPTARSGRLEADDAVANRVPLFPLELAAQESATYYLSLRNDVIYSLRLSLQTPEKVFQTERVWQYASGFFFGCVAIMFLYNLFLGISTKDIGFLWYSLALLFIHGGVLSVLIGNGEYFGIKLLAGMKSIVILSKMLGLTALLIFSMDFLHTKRVPIFNNLLKAALWIQPVFIVLAFLMPAAKVNALHNLVLLPTVLSLMFYSAQLFFRGVTYARFYFYAWCPLLFVILIHVSLNMTGQAHLMPRMDLLLLAASLMEVLLLSMALADKINEIKRQNLFEQKKHNEEISALNRSLEIKVEERTRDIRTMLDNIKLGVFTIDQEGRIAPDYSQYLEAIYDERGLNKHQPLDLILLNSNLGIDARSRCQTALDNSLGADSLSFLGNETHLIRDIERNRDGQKQSLELDWAPIVSKDDRTEKILVSVRDVTEVLALRLETASREHELGLVRAFKGQGANDIHVLSSLLDEAGTIHASMLRAAREGGDSLPHLQQLFRIFHTAKALARKLKLRELADELHHAEDSLRDALQPSQAWSVPEIDGVFHRVHSIMETYREKIQKLGFSVKSGATEATALITEAYIMGLLEERKSLALELGKGVPKLQINCSLSGPMPTLVRSFLDTALLHLLRNSMDHGLETPELRQELGKPSEGVITIEIRDVAGFYECRYSDDGRGLNLDDISAKAMELKTIENTAQWSDLQLANLILLPGFSTKTVVSDISGRGMGMDAVGAWVREQKGTIEIVWQVRDSDSTQSKSRPFALVVRLPKNASAQERAAA